MREDGEQWTGRLAGTLGGAFEGAIGPLPNGRGYSTTGCSLSDHYTPKGFHKELGFVKEEEKVPHPCQWYQQVSLSFSLFLCPRLPAISLRLLLQGPSQQACFLPLVSTSLFRRISVIGFAASALCPLWLHLLTCTFISHRSNNNAALFKLY